MLILLSIILFLIAWNRGIALLYGMFSLLLATLTVAKLAPYWMLSRVEVERRHSNKSTEGQNVTIALQLKNRGWFSRHMLEIWDRLPFADDSFNPAMSFVPQLRDQSSLKLEVPCQLRGVYPLGQLTLKTGFPLGIFTAEREIQVQSSSLVVYPTPFEISYFDYLSNDSLPIQGNRAIMHAGSSGDFMGVREYRHGDSPRHIHWPSTARHGDLIVREFEWISTTRLTLLLNLNRGANYGEGKESTLEYAIKIAVSLARHALDHGHSVSLLGYGTHPIEIPPGKGEAHYQTLLEALAHAQADGEIPYQESLRHTIRHSAHQGILVFFDCPPPDGPGITPPAVQHPRLVRVRFDSKSFLYPVNPRPTASYRHAGGIPTYNIGRGADLAKLFSST